MIKSYILTLKICCRTKGRWRFGLEQSHMMASLQIKILGFLLITNSLWANNTWLLQNLKQLLVALMSRCTIPRSNSVTLEILSSEHILEGTLTKCNAHRRHQDDENGVLWRIVGRVESVFLKGKKKLWEEGYRR